MPRTQSDIDVPDLAGRLAVVTGASDGIGFHVASRLARAGADLLLPVRSEAKGEAARRRILAASPGADVSLALFDLASLKSVTDLAADISAAGRPINVLINNAGVMRPPARQLTEDGYELQYGVNFLGQAALTTALLPQLRAGNARVTTQIALAADQNKVAWDDLQSARRYHSFKAYNSSKIAMGLWALALDRHSSAEGWGISSNLAHPGIAPTNLLAAQPGMGRPKDTVGVKMIRALSRRHILFGTADIAALSAVRAATDPNATGGELYSPRGFGHLQGLPDRQKMYRRLADTEGQERIWALAQQQLAAAAIKP